jgi:hypothetical protein
MDLESATGQIALIPGCPVHGMLYPCLSQNTWICSGWNGEGCGHQVRMEDLDWIPVRNVTMTGITWT